MVVLSKLLDGFGLFLHFSRCQVIFLKWGFVVISKHGFIFFLFFFLFKYWGECQQDLKENYGVGFVLV